MSTSAASSNGRASWQLIVSIVGTSVLVIGSIVNLYTRMTQAEAALTEIETQFRAHENYYNLMRADQLRTNAILWQAVFKTEYPSAAFYPSISK